MTRFIGGPLDGRYALNSRAAYRDATTGQALKATFGDRWFGRNLLDAKVQAKLRSFYVKQGQLYVWAPLWRVWYDAGKPEQLWPTWQEDVEAHLQTLRERSA
jgi:hypothetical protein